MRIKETLTEHTEKSLQNVDIFSVFCNINIESKVSERVGSSKCNEDLRIFLLFSVCFGQHTMRISPRSRV